MGCSAEMGLGCGCLFRLGQGRYEESGPGSEEREEGRAQSEEAGMRRGAWPVQAWLWVTVVLLLNSYCQDARHRYTFHPSQRNRSRPPNLNTS